MDKEIIEKLNEKIDKELNYSLNEKKDLISEIEKEESKSSTENYILKQYNEDLEKINKEIENHNLSKNTLKENLEKYEEFKTQKENNEKAIAALEKDKSEIAEELKNNERKFEFKNGKLETSFYVEELKNDLEKVEKEIADKKEKNMGLSEKIEETEKIINDIREKYKVKENKKSNDIEEKEEKQEQKEKEEEIEETEKIEDDKEKEETTNKKSEVEKQEEQETILKVETKQDKNHEGRNSTARKVSINEKSCNVKNIKFDITSGYTIAIKDDKGEEIIEHFNLEDVLKEKENNKKNSKENIKDKCFDSNLYSILKKIDNKYQTNSAINYKRMLTVKYLKNRDKSNDLEIDYDFSNMIKKPEKSIWKSYKKIAKECSKLEIAKYEKAPNPLKRFLKSITMKKLPVNSQVNNKDNDILNSYKELHDEEEFDIEEFIKTYNLGEKEAEEYREKFNEYNLEKDKKKSFRDKINGNFDPKSIKNPEVSQVKETDEKENQQEQGKEIGE